MTKGICQALGARWIPRGKTQVECLGEVGKPLFRLAHYGASTTQEHIDQAAANKAAQVPTDINNKQPVPFTTKDFCELNNEFRYTVGRF